MQKITFADKVSTIISSLPIINRIRAEDINEIKSVVNNNAGIVAYDDIGTNSNITFEESVEGAKEIEIVYYRYNAGNDTKYYKSTGKIKYTSGMTIALDLTYATTDQMQLNTINVTVTDTGITFGDGYYVNLTSQNYLSGFAANTSIYIEKVTIYN